MELVLTAFKSWTVHKIIEYLTLGLLSSFWNIYHLTTAYFFDPPCIWVQPQYLRLDFAENFVAVSSFPGMSDVLLWSSVYSYIYFSFSLFRS